jgi:Pentapeptide repeats (9 copies)
MDYICPITQEPIKVAGILCSGSFFEYDAISNWLHDHNSDPLTNLYLPTKFVVKFTNLNYLKVKANDIRQSTKVWCKGIYFEDDFKFYSDKLINLKTQRDIVYALPEYQTFEQSMHDNKTLNALTSQAYYRQGKPIIVTEGRPVNTGIDAQFLRLKNMTYENLMCKNSSFDLCQFTDCVFINCNFSDCSFLGATFNNVKFIQCSFLGGRFTLYDATGSINISNCTFEYLNWKPAKHLNDIITALTRERRFKGTVSNI